MVVQLRVPPLARARSRSVAANLMEGVVFIWRHPTLRTQMCLALVPVVIALPYNALLPIFASSDRRDHDAGHGWPDDPREVEAGCV